DLGGPDAGCDWLPRSGLRQAATLDRSHGGLRAPECDSARRVRFDRTRVPGRTGALAPLGGELGRARSRLRARGENPRAAAFGRRADRADGRDPRGVPRGPRARAGRDRDRTVLADAPPLEGGAPAGPPAVAVRDRRLADRRRDAVAPAAGRLARVARAVA